MLKLNMLLQKVNNNSKMSKSVKVMIWITLISLTLGNTMLNNTVMGASMTPSTTPESLNDTITDVSTVAPINSEFLKAMGVSMAPSTDSESLKNTIASVTRISNPEIQRIDYKVTVPPSTSTTAATKTLKEEEKEILHFINSILRQMLPRVMRGSSTNLSQRCIAAMMKIVGGLRKLKGWTLKILDSMGKPIPGILRGTAYSAASFDQCLNLSITHKGEESFKSEDVFFHGQYCRIRIGMSEAELAIAQKYKQAKINGSQLGKLREVIDVLPYIPFTKYPMSHFLGLCLPSLCSTEDISKLLKSLPFPGSATLNHCETKKKLTVDFEKRIVLGIFFLLLLIIVIGSALDKLIHYFAEENLNVYLKKRVVSMAMSFSIFSNTDKLFLRVENDTNDFPNWRVLRGLVVGTVFSLIVYHTYLPPFDPFYIQASNLSDLEDYLNQSYFALVVCLPIVIETLFLSYGFSLTNKIWKSTWKSDKKTINVFYIIIASYVRLSLPLLLCTGIVILLPLVGSGAFWNDVFSDTYENCQTFWWRHLAIFSNFLDENEQCFPHFWFVPCLLQIIFAATILTYIASRYRRIGIFLIVSVVLGCSIAVGVLTFNHDFPPTNIAYFALQKTDEFWRINYALPLNHAGSFAIGMLLGVFMATGNSVKVKPVISIMGWILALGYIVGMCMLMFSYRGKNEFMTPAWSAVFAAAHRPLFAMAVAWIFWASAYGYGGFVGRVLSCSLMDPLYRMSYFAYLIHLIIIAFHVGTAREHFGYSHIESVIRGLGYIWLSYGIAYICCLVIDLPLKSLRSSLSPSNFRQVNITSLQNIAKFNQPRKYSNPAISNTWIMENGTNEGK